MLSKQDSGRIAKVYSDENSSCFAYKGPLWGTPSRSENLTLPLDTEWTVWQLQQSMTLCSSPISLSSHVWPQLILKPTTFPNPFFIWPNCGLYLMSGHHTTANVAQSLGRFSGSLSRPTWTGKVEALSVSLSRKEDGIALPSYSSKKVKQQLNAFCMLSPEVGPSRAQHLHSITAQQHPGQTVLLGTSIKELSKYVRCVFKYFLSSHLSISSMHTGFQGWFCSLLYLWNIICTE